MNFSSNKYIKKNFECDLALLKKDMNNTNAVHLQPDISKINGQQHLIIWAHFAEIINLNDKSSDYMYNELKSCVKKK